MITMLIVLFHFPVLRWDNMEVFKIIIFTCHLIEVGSPTCEITSLIASCPNSLLVLINPLEEREVQETRGLEMCKPKMHNILEF